MKKNIKIVMPLLASFCLCSCSINYDYAYESLSSKITSYENTYVYEKYNSDDSQIKYRYYDRISMYKYGVNNIVLDGNFTINGYTYYKKINLKIYIPMEKTNVFDVCYDLYRVDVINPTNSTSTKVLSATSKLYSDFTSKTHLGFTTYKTILADSLIISTQSTNDIMLTRHVAKTLQQLDTYTDNEFGFGIKLLGFKDFYREIR